MLIYIHCFFFQAAAPVFTLLFPMMLTIICLYFRTKTSGVDLLAMMVMGWNGTINSTSAIFLVKPYRGAIIQMLKDLKNSPYTIGHGAPIWITTNMS